jgi:hypothetical protein
MAVAGFAAIDFGVFHRDELPRRLRDGRGVSAARAAAPFGSLALRLLDGAAFTYAPRGDGIAIEAGDDAADTVIELDQESWEGLVHDYEASAGLLYASRARCRRGDAMRLVLWEPALRCLYTGREIFDEAGLALRDLRGAPLDVSRVFSLAEDSEEMSHFLRTAGFLLVRGVFAPPEVDGFLGEARELAGEARPGDKLSWWSKDARGVEVLCRVTRAAAKPRLATLPSDPRVLGLAALAGTELVHRDGEGNGVTVIFKNPGIREGLSDLPWHRDCGMGGHALMCPVVIVSTYLTPANAATGELRFLPGSHTRACGFVDARDPRAPRGVSFDAQPGDVSVHFGDVMHAAPPPARGDLAGYRVSAITGFAPPSARVHRGKSYNEALHRRDDGQIEHLTRVAAQQSEASAPTPGTGERNA